MEMEMGKRGLFFCCLPRVAIVLTIGFDRAPAGPPLDTERGERVGASNTGYYREFGGGKETE